MFIVALSTIAKLWKQPKCPSIDEWIKKMWLIDKRDVTHTHTHTHTHTLEYYLAIKRTVFIFGLLCLNTLLLSFD